MKQTLSLILLLWVAFTVNAQKMSSKSIGVNFHVKPSLPLPQNDTYYRPKLITPINPLTKEEEIQAFGSMNFNVLSAEKRKRVVDSVAALKIKEYEKAFLTLDAPKFIIGNGWSVTLETSDVAVTYLTDKSISDLTSKDDIIRYSYSAKLTITDIAGKLILDKIISATADEKRMTKGELLLNPLFKLKAGIYANNPEKQKKIADDLLERKNHLVLNNILQLADRELTAAYQEQFKKFTVSLFSVKGKAYDELNDVRDKIMDTYMKFHAFSKKNRLPKEAMDNVLKESVPVWEKYLNTSNDLEEKARKGLMLNIVLANTWIGEYEKAEVLLNQVEEAFVADPLETMPDESNAPGESFLPFSTYAENLRRVFEHFKKHRELIVIYQG